MHPLSKIDRFDACCVKTVFFFGLDFYIGTSEKHLCLCERNAVKRSKLYGQGRMSLGFANI